jgi:hypothetical protein
MTRSFMTDLDRHREQDRRRSRGVGAPAESTVPRATGREVEVTGWRRLQGAVLTGLLGAVAMFLVLAAFAVGQGRGPSYPLRAVQGMISGRRVIPDHPVGSVRDLSVLDHLVGPASFVFPALVAALATLWWVVRRHGGDDSARSVAPAAFVTTCSLFVVLVLAVGYQEAGAPLQRISSGYGVRALGLPAWVVGHLAFATLLTLCLGPITRVVSTRRRGTWESLRGESPTTPVDGGSR